jgi:predicted DNA-binding transcriptional regulator YafY
MPYLSEKIKIEQTKHDRRIKLSDDEKDLIRWLREEEKLSQRVLANQFNVSRRTIQFILSPEKLEENKKRREERGGWKQYYDKEKNTESIKDTRNYKQRLFVKGEITLKEKNN